MDGVSTVQMLVKLFTVLSISGKAPGSGSPLAGEYADALSFGSPWVLVCSHGEAGAIALHFPGGITTIRSDDQLATLLESILTKLG